MNYSHYDTLIVERRGPVGWLINNRPDRLNAMSAHMRDEFAVAWRELDADPDVRVIVHTGEGRAFQTGVDVAEIASDGVGMERYRQAVLDNDQHFTAWQQQVWKPVITAVNGICAGGGFHWVAEADIVIAASDAEFFDPHVSVGQVVAMEAIGLARRIPFEAVMRMAFLGRYERLSAERVYQLGMISQIVDPPERLRDEAQALAETIARNSPAAMRATKRALWAALEMGLTDACKAGAVELVSMWGHPDQEEGPRAFAEKTRPGMAALGSRGRGRGSIMPGFASAVLAPAGVHTLYGSPSSDLPVVRADERIARVLAEAHRAVLNRPAAAVTASGSLLEVPGVNGEAPDELVVTAADNPLELVGRIRSALGRGGLLMQLDVDAHTHAGHRHWPTADEVADSLASSTALLESDAAARIKAVAARVDSAASVVVLAGPGVVRAHCVAGLHALAGALGAGVLNTWGAKGVFHWQSRHHWATIGLQEHDFALGGLGDTGLIVATGVDDREAPGEYWRGRPHVVVEPEDLDVLAEVITPRRHDRTEMPPLRTRLAAATQAGWVSTAAPLAPSQATLAYGRRLAGGGLVAADAGMAGFWVARTFATTELGGVAVPAEETPGWAAACVTVARMAAPLRPALAVLSEKVDDATSLVLELAASHGLAVGLEVWSEGGEALDAERHRSRLGVLTDPSAGGVATIATDTDQVDAFVEAAGPLRPWRPPRRAAGTS